jgi:excisionase family DNA binding protein
VALSIRHFLFILPYHPRIHREAFRLDALSFSPPASIHDIPLLAHHHFWSHESRYSACALLLYSWFYQTFEKRQEKQLMTQNPSETLLTVREIADRLRVDDTTVRRWIKNGVLEAITLPHQGKRRAYRIQQSTLDTLLSSSTPIQENS